MQLLDGKALSQRLNVDLKSKVDKLAEGYHRVPHLAIILVGDNGASQSYVKGKLRSCQEVGFKSTLIKLDSEIEEWKLIETIHTLNSDPTVDGIIVQLPLPSHIKESNIVGTIVPTKDVDGFTPTNVSKLYLEDSTAFIPATPYGILMLLDSYGIEVEGKHVVVVGRSNIVGRPLSLLLSQQRDVGNATVTLCHSKTTNLQAITSQADILIAAIGIPGYVTVDMIKRGATVIDVGITRVEDREKTSGYRVVGDVDYKNIAPLCSYITPVPGGVGPMTVAALLQNTYRAYLRVNKF